MRCALAHRRRCSKKQVFTSSPSGGGDAASCTERKQVRGETPCARHPRPLFKGERSIAGIARSRERVRTLRPLSGICMRLFLLHDSFAVAPVAHSFQAHLLGGAMAAESVQTAAGLAVIFLMALHACVNECMEEFQCHRVTVCVAV